MTPVKIIIISSMEIMAAVLSTAQNLLCEDLHQVLLQAQPPVSGT